MKSNRYLWVLLATTTLTMGACSNGDDNSAPLSQEKTAQVQLTLEGVKVANTKANGTTTPTQADENKLLRYTVAIFNSDESVNTIQTLIGTNTSPTLSCKPAAACTGVVVANAKSDTYFAGVTTKTEFMAKTVALADGQTSTALPMSGDVKSSSNTTFTLAAGNNTGMTVELSRLVARISISSIATNFDANGQYAQASFQPTNIFIRDAQAAVIPQTGDATTTTPSTAAFLTGNYAGSTSRASYLTEAISTTAMSGTASYSANKYWFYLFPNSSTNNPTALVIEGIFKATSDDAETTVYYPIIINKTQLNTNISGGTGTTSGNISRNTLYTLTATIRSIGTTSPTGNIDPASLNITINVANWALSASQDIIFE